MVASGKMFFEDFVDLLTIKPARFFGLSSKGTLRPGYEADLIVIDPEKSSDWFGVNKSTISRRFATNIIKGKSTGKISLRRAMYTKALEGNVVMQIWLSKQYLGMKERVETSEEAKPLPWID